MLGIEHPIVPGALPLEVKLLRPKEDLMLGASARRWLAGDGATAEWF
jgi:hypothetical protein